MRFPLLLLFALAAWPGGIAAADDRAALLTKAEATGFSATPTYEETLAFLRQLEPRLPEMKLTFFGRSGEGRPLPLVIVSQAKAFTPEAAARTGRPVVLFVNGIHAGEIDGKDACLMLLRDWACGRRRELLDAGTLLIVPIYNVDGHEKISPTNRPNQDGPAEGMGFRTNAIGLDLNRDHVKLASPEARSLVGLFNAWRPHLHVDNHVTDGSDHDWLLTYGHTSAPQAAPAIDAWMQRAIASARAALLAQGVRSGPYVDLVDGLDPAKGINSGVSSPRQSTGYFNLRHRPSILVEMHSYKPYAKRVPANRDFLAALLDFVRAHPQDLLAAVRAAETRTVELGKPGAEPSQLVLNWEGSGEADRILLPIYAWSTEDSPALGRPLLHYQRGVVREIEVPWYHRAKPALTVPRPRGYLVLPGWPQIEERLEGHGLKVRRLEKPVTALVETLRLSQPRFESRSYQGLVGVKVTVERKPERRSFPAGTIWIPADQPDFEVAAQLLEPEASDSLVSWGLLSTIWERKEYIDPGVLDRLARAMLEDPVIAAEWEAALKDETLAKDSSARYLWWYRKTPYWDSTVGLAPVFPLPGPLPD